MAASDLKITEAAIPTHHSRSEQTGTDATSGKPILAQVVLAGVHKRVYRGVQSLVLSGVAQSLTVPAGAPAVFGDIYSEGATINDYARYWHGATPTSAVGKRLKDHEEIQSASPSDFLALAGSGTPTLRVEYYSNP